MMNLEVCSTYEDNVSVAPGDLIAAVEEIADGIEELIDLDIHFELFQGGQQSGEGDDSVGARTRKENL